MFPYKYTIVDISEKNETGFKAIIPAFPHLYIVADSAEELNQAVQTLVEEEIQEMKIQKKKIPTPDNEGNFTGNFTLRIKPALHKRISELAQAKGSSLNSFISENLEKVLSLKDY